MMSGYWEEEVQNQNKKKLVVPQGENVCEAQYTAIPDKEVTPILKTAKHPGRQRAENSTSVFHCAA